MPTEVEQILAVFEKFDTAKDGLMDKAELAKVLQIIDPTSWNTESLKVLSDFVDTSKDGKVKVEAFVNWAFASPADKTAPSKESSLDAEANTSNVAQGAKESKSEGKQGEERDSKPDDDAPAKGEATKTPAKDNPSEAALVDEATASEQGKAGEVAKSSDEQKADPAKSKPDDEAKSAAEANESEAHKPDDEAKPEMRKPEDEAKSACEPKASEEGKPVEAASLSDKSNDEAAKPADAAKEAKPEEVKAPEEARPDEAKAPGEAPPAEDATEAKPAPEEATTAEGAKDA